jgi:meso-butanediol dehydrogenase/(S,S)-butanediol dehydrogenase/diacetyl reductase
MKGLNNKRVVITGGVSGIGAATVERFLAENCRVAVIDCDEVGGQNLRKKYADLISVIHADVSDPIAVEAAFRELDNTLGGPDITINNAGISMRHSFLDITAEEWRKVTSVVLDGIFYVAQQSAKRMLNGGGGVIINMGSTSGLVGHPKYADYNAAKSGVIELTRTMALELAPTIRVIAVCPGYVWTAMQEAEYTAEMKAALEAKIPLRRHATPAEIAALFAFLASEEAPYITGHPIIIDGGETAGGLASR